jgi:hypothetical protein
MRQKSPSQCTSDENETDPLAKNKESFQLAEVLTRLGTAVDMIGQQKPPQSCTNPCTKRAPRDDSAITASMDATDKDSCFFATVYRSVKMLRAKKELNRAAAVKPSLRRLPKSKECLKTFIGLGLSRFRPKS